MIVYKFQYIKTFTGRYAVVLATSTETTPVVLGISKDEAARICRALNVALAKATKNVVTANVK